MKKSKHNKNTSTDVIKVINIAESTDFRLVESYKALRTNLLFSLPAKEETNCRKILFTSAGPGEGKSTTTVNLAVSLSQTEVKVLLIDADLRKPTVHRYFGIQSRLGLSNLLSGMNSREECIHSVKDLPNLSVIPAGILPPNPSELLSSSAMGKLLSDFEKIYDYIIIDTPPVNVVTDALALVSRVDGVAFVTAYRKSTYPEISRAVASLRFANANILGVVLNGVVHENGKYGFGKNRNVAYSSYSYKYKYKSTDNSQSTPSANK